MKAIRFIEKILIVLSIIGVIMKFTDAAGADLFIDFPLLLIALLYFVGGYFFLKEKESNENDKWISVITGIFFSLSVLGMILKLGYWPGAQLFLLIGMIGAVVLTNIAIAKRKRNEENVSKAKYYHSLINKCSIVIVLSAVLFSIPQSTLIRLQYRSDPKHAQLIIDFRADPEDKAKWERLVRYEHKMEMKEEGFQPGDTIYYPQPH